MRIFFLTNLFLDWKYLCIFLDIYIFIWKMHSALQLLYNSNLYSLMLIFLPIFKIENPRVTGCWQSYFYMSSFIIHWHEDYWQKKTGDSQPSQACFLLSNFAWNTTSFPDFLFCCCFSNHKTHTLLAEC